jgi:hypothetical protein
MLFFGTAHDRDDRGTRPDFLSFNEQGTRATVPNLRPDCDPVSTSPLILKSSPVTVLIILTALSFGDVIKNGETGWFIKGK